MTSVQSPAMAAHSCVTTPKEATTVSASKATGWQKITKHALVRATNSCTSLYFLVSSSTPLFEFTPQPYTQTSPYILTSPYTTPHPPPTRISLLAPIPDIRESKPSYQLSTLLTQQVKLPKVKWVVNINLYLFKWSVRKIGEKTNKCNSKNTK